MVWVGIAVFVVIILSMIVVALNSASQPTRKRRASASSSYEMPRASGTRNKGKMGKWMKQHGTDKIAVERKKAKIKAYNERQRKQRGNSK